MRCMARRPRTLLLWTSEFSEAQAVARCDPIIFNYRWAQQAMLDADVFVMAVGQHFTSKLAHAPSAYKHALRQVLTEHLAFCLRHYQPSALQGVQREFH